MYLKNSKKRNMFFTFDSDHIHAYYYLYRVYSLKFLLFKNDKNPNHKSFGSFHFYEFLLGV